MSNQNSWKELEHLKAPEELVHLDQWVCWKAIPKSDGSGATKKPMRDASNYATSTDRTTWTDYQTARGYYEESNRALAGVGYVLTADDPYLALDWDHVVNEKGEIDPEVLKAIEDLGCYAELSPSGYVVRAFVSGSVPVGLKCGATLQFWDCKRFITITGHTIQDLPISEPSPELLKEVIERFNPPTPAANGSGEPQQGQQTSTIDYNRSVGSILSGNALHDSLRDLAASMSAYGLPREATQGLLTGLMEHSTAINTARGIERLQEIPRLVESAFQKFATDFDNQDPVNLFESLAFKPFPTDILPAPIRDFVEDQSDRMGVDPALLGMCGLAIAASAISDEIKIQPKMHDPAWQESARLWATAIGDPSVGKSPAQKVMSTPVQVQEAAWRALNSAAIEAYEQAKQAARKAGTALPAHPECHRACVDDITVEKLGDVLQHTPRGTLVFKDELSEWFESMDAYRSKGGGNKDQGHYLSAYNGGPRTVDRIGRGELYIPNFSVSIYGGIQPTAIQRVAKRLADDGLLPRFNPFYVRDPVAGHDRPQGEDLRGAYLEFMARLYELPNPGQPIKYSPAAIRFQEQIERHSLAFSTNKGNAPKLRAHAGKWRGMFARYALILHVLDGLDAGGIEAEISEDTAKRTGRLFAEFLMPNAWHFFGGEDAGGDTWEDAKWIAGYILSRNLTEIARREIQMNYRRMRKAPDLIASSMKLLASLGWVTIIEQRQGVDTRWAINPKVHGLFQVHAQEEAARREEMKAYMAQIFRNP